LESVKSTPSIKPNKQIPMKKIYALFFAAFASATAFAQMPVTFSVDMATQTVNPLGVHIAGNFQDPKL
jgi:hypothetical protein